MEPEQTALNGRRRRSFTFHHDAGERRGTAARAAATHESRSKFHNKSTKNF